MDIYIYSMYMYTYGFLYYIIVLLIILYLEKPYGFIFISENSQLDEEKDSEFEKNTSFGASHIVKQLRSYFKITSILVIV